ncbi:MAG: phage tail protein [Anaerolineae bacterium]|nr:phage tail protein [Anaerolineae bacterium]
MKLGDRSDPYLAFTFQVEIEGVVVGGFSEVTGLQAEIEIQDYREGGCNDYIHRLAGPARYPSNLVLKRGMTDIDGLWRWQEEVLHGNVQRKNGSVVMFDGSGEEKLRWNFTNAYPVRWVGPELRANSAAVAIESLELVHEGLSKPR